MRAESVLSEILAFLNVTLTPRESLHIYIEKCHHLG